MFRNIRSLELWDSSFRLRPNTQMFFLQMLDDKMSKPNNKKWLKCEYHFKKKTMKQRRKCFNGTLKSTFFEKWILSFQTLNSTFHA